MVLVLFTSSSLADRWSIALDWDLRFLTVAVVFEPLSHKQNPDRKGGEVRDFDLSYLFTVPSAMGHTGPATLQLEPRAWQG